MRKSIPSRRNSKSKSFELWACLLSFSILTISWVPHSLHIISMWSTYFSYCLSLILHVHNEIRLLLYCIIPSHASFEFQLRLLTYVTILSILFNSDWKSKFPLVSFLWLHMILSQFIKWVGELRFGSCNTECQGYAYQGYVSLGSVVKHLSLKKS